MTKRSGGCGIYAIWVTKAGVERPYVGSSVQLEIRRKQHFTALALGKHYNYKLHRAWKRFGPSSFRFEVLFCCEPSERFLLEELTIRLLDSFHNGYNLTPNVTQGVRHGLELSEARRRNMAAAARKRYEDDEERNKTSQSLKEFWANAENREEILAVCRTPEYRTLARERTTNNWKDSEIRRRRTDGLNKAMTDESRNRRSVAATGKGKSESHRAAISSAKKRLYANSSEREKVRERSLQPETHAKLSDKSLRAWQNPEYRDHLVESRREQWTRPGFKERVGRKIKEALAALNADQERASRRSKSITEGKKRAWVELKADPERYARFVAAQRRAQTSVWEYRKQKIVTC